METYGVWYHEVTRMKGREWMRRLTLAQKPTPLEPLTRLGELLRIDLWVKRDDLTGDMVTGGNKIRKLEYLLADALDKGADTIITTGGPQSNHAKTTAALTKRLGLHPVLLLSGKPPEETTANLLINKLVGAEVHYFFPRHPREMDDALLRLAEEMKAKGRKPYIIPVGGSNGIGTLGYIDAYQEMDQQRQEKQLSFDFEFVTAGSGGTFAGIYMGHQAVQASSKLIGVSPWLPSQEIKERIIDCIKDARTLSTDSVPLSGEPALEDLSIYDQYIGSGYAKPTPEGMKALQIMASEESILLDHVYTAKTMAGLMDLVEKGVIARGSSVLFWHTGGAPGLFALQERWSEWGGG
ncbi:1-aminocyclopropane-1-carboxylate deaminase/D-cysteine desulfhydrase [Ammoniphilus sp. CFH 90114]|uniref:1-aminocyclopropane-1-carboxylate deaminase/D-cysteine desulfhydrase n=1 Tax=Ammoniphilus sp. CFH 90114 TaxID=2493665 RepID=UPI00100E9BFD|nr:D-cysteine desulfhydrase family protein [Ammoniphilus sp. CFH 90114]RXT04883.1 D-cysteine desulfhydrase family protein [Ammoniphilus sp. CFH 90114]